MTIRDYLKEKGFKWPEKKKISLKQWPTTKREYSIYDTGYNQALSEIKPILGMKFPIGEVFT